MTLELACALVSATCLVGGLVGGYCLAAARSRRVVRQWLLLLEHHLGMEDRQEGERRFWVALDTFLLALEERLFFWKEWE